MIVYPSLESQGMYIATLLDWMSTNSDSSNGYFCISTTSATVDLTSCTVDNLVDIKAAFLATTRCFSWCSIQLYLPLEIYSYSGFHQFVSAFVSLSKYAPVQHHQPNLDFIYWIYLIGCETLALKRLVYDWFWRGNRSPDC